MATGWTGEERRKVCTPEGCQYHALTDMVVTDLKQAVEKLLEGQQEMKETVIKLSENMKAFDRLDERLDKLEELQRMKEKEQDAKIDTLRIFMYKTMGVVTAVLTALSVASKFLGG